MRYEVIGSAALALGLATAGPAGAYGRGGFARGGAVAGPAGGYAYGGARGGYAAGPYGAAAGGARGGTYEGPRGTEVQAGRAGGVEAGPYGGVRAGGADAVRVTTPGGRTYTDVDRASAAAGPFGGVRVGESGRTTVSGPAGAVGTGYRVGGIGTPYAGWAGGGVRVGGAVGHSTAYWGGDVVRTTAVGVRSGVYPYFTPGWYAGHAGAWVAPRWVGGYNLWAVPTWAAVAGFVGVAAAPVVYDYGSTVVLQNDAVTVNGEPAGTAAAYATQAAALADAGRTAAPAAADEWQPLGVFGLVQPGDATAQRVFQLAVNRAGVVRGNYYDALSDATQPVAGSVDKATQRVAWSIGDKKDVVFEAGLDTLTKAEGTVLVHHGTDRTQQMLLVRLEQPPAGK